MGTRGLTAVIEGGTHKVAQYGQWDHYPEGQGVTALTFLRDSGKLDALREKVGQAHYITGEEVDSLYAAAGIDVSSGFITMDDSKMFGELYPALTRDTGAGILEVVADAPAGIGLQDSFSFATDSLFCEYAYVVDLDRNVFEAYVGFQHHEHQGAGVFTSLGLDTSEHRTEQYYPVRLMVQYPLDKLPTDEDFVTTCKAVERGYSDSPENYDDEDYPAAISGPVLVS